MRLDVHLEGARGPVGKIDAEGSRFSFSYDASYLRAPDNRPLSLSMPLRDRALDEPASRFFFDNLLPEGRALSDIARQHDLQDNDTAGLLAEIGAECAGAVGVVREGAPAPKHPGRFPDHYRAVSDEQLGEILKNLVEGRHPLPRDAQDMLRGGVQSKTAVLVDKDGCIHLATRGAPTTHILKVADAHFPRGVENEFFCMRLAAALGLAAAAVEMRVQENVPFLLVKRYDRIIHSDRTVHRLHQEDFAQGVGLPPACKYTHKGGRPLEYFFGELDKAAMRPALLRRDLLRYVLFTYLIGNSDAHAKNFSLLHRSRADGGTRLAPLYDAACIVLYRDFRQGMALSIGGKQAFDEIGRDAWDAFARATKLRYRFVRDEMAEIATAIVPTAKRLREELPGLTDFGAGRIVDAIGQQVRLASDSFKLGLDPDTGPTHEHAPGWAMPS